MLVKLTLSKEDLLARSSDVGGVNPLQRSHEILAFKTLCARVCVCVCEYVCVGVLERERERGGVFFKINGERARRKEKVQGSGKKEREIAKEAYSIWKAQIKERQF